MAFTTGTATNHKDLMDQIRVLITDPVFMGAGSEWTQLRWDTNLGGTGEYELAIEGPGFGVPGGNPVAHMRTYTGAAPTYGNWGLQTSLAWDPGLAYGLQPGTPALSFGKSRYACFDAVSFDFWFYANGHRFIIVADLGGFNSMCYMGFVSPPGLIDDYPYPFVCGGTYSDFDRDPYDNDLNSNVFCSYNGSIIRTPGGNWQDLDSLVFGSQVHQDAGEGFLSSFEGQAPTAITVWPWAAMYYPEKFGQWYWMQNLDGTYPLLPSTIMNRNGGLGPRGTLGHLTGVYHIPGDGVNPGDTITTPDLKVYRVFRNYWRGGRYQICAIREE